MMPFLWLTCELVSWYLEAGEVARNFSPGSRALHLGLGCERVHESLDRISRVKEFPPVTLASTVTWVALSIRMPS